MLVFIAIGLSLSWLEGRDKRAAKLVSKIVAIFTTVVNQVHDRNAARQTTCSATVLQLYHLD